MTLVSRSMQVRGQKFNLPTWRTPPTGASRQVGLAAQELAGQIAKTASRSANGVSA